ncbi:MULTISPECIES: DUF1127 domain-containing protein [unclassified Ruegeria]|uniref:DUF1127 domain-containing protein n=1 Tax=unclassified Ruegeria TaxID=2625375 RepID=UPI001492EA1D|nr:MULTISPECIES: DUF1127 domain-containing protein [unclassified Ruegeria]NOD33091.1 DUF1127 domain-containing protein [Ruegeria sp. HKCCD7296]NOE41681.1 DUF1127 domain-containing protein [Ruegeria sp. HKCCD7319]
MVHTQAVNTQNGLLDGLFSKYADKKVEHFRRRILAKTVRDLEKLDDQQLADIGVQRDQINRYAYESVYHNKPYRQ